MGNLHAVLLHLEMFNMLPTENIMKGNEQSQSLFLFGFLIHIHLPCCRQVQIFCDYKRGSKHSATVTNKIRPPPPSIKGSTKPTLRIKKSQFNLIGIFLKFGECRPVLTRIYVVTASKGL